MFAEMLRKIAISIPAITASHAIGAQWVLSDVSNVGGKL